MTDPDVVHKVVAAGRERFGADYRSAYLWGSHARGDAIETSDIDMGVFVRGRVPEAERLRAENEIDEAMGEQQLDFAVVGDDTLTGRDAVTFRFGARRIDGEDLSEIVPLPSREEWMDFADEAALHWVTRKRPRPFAPDVAPLRADDEFLGYVDRTITIRGRETPMTKTPLGIAGRIATANVARASGRFVGDRPQAIQAYGEDVGGALAGYLVELQECLRTRWRYLVPTSAADRATLGRLCRQTLEFEREFIGRVAADPRGPRTDRLWTKIASGRPRFMKSRTTVGPVDNYDQGSEHGWPIKLIGL